MQSINIYVGENSSGKSMRLGDIARDNIKSGRTVIAIATSFNDKYPKRKPNAPYFYMGPRLGQSMAKKAIKSSISKLNEKDGLLQLNTLFSILEYTKIEPQIGLIIKGFNNYFDDDLEEIQFINNADKELALYLCYKIRSHYDKYNDFIHWISSYSRFNEGLSGEFLSDIIKHEKLLRKYKLIRGVELYVKKDDLSLPINKLSSGQLSLISTTFFIASYLRNGAVILIDEPENSLHPSWQRQYISNLKDLFPYYECEYHIATHSPMIISGAIDEKGVKVHRHNGTYFEEIEINTKNIEDAYIDQFGIVTPENNSLSERCIDIINSVNDGELSKYKAISILNKYKSASFESLQEEFINGVIDIVNDLGGGVMPKIKFTKDQISYMKMANSMGHSGWSLNKLKPIKAKIKKQKREDLEDTCCYCQRDTNGEFNMVLDIEHIIPKSTRLRHMFTMKNLTISCKRCNMKIKNTDTSFLSVPIENLPRRVFKSKYYKFIHPNIDDIESHIERNVIQKGKIRIVKYLIQNNSEKGWFTYRYFKLKDFEIDAANQSQGRRKRKIKNKKAAEAFAALLK